MPAADATQRRARLAAAIEDAKKNRREITRDEIMVIWGVTPGRLTQILNQIPGFPAAKSIKNKLYFPRKSALKMLWDWEHKGDAEQRDKQARLAAIMGVDQESPLMHLTPGEMIKASQAAADVQERLHRQGALVARTDVRTTAIRVFELLSRRLSNLGTALDPNGRWDPEMREKADKAGESLLLSIYAEMNDMLSDNEPAPADRPSRHRTAAARARPLRVSDESE